MAVWATATPAAREEETRRGDGEKRSFVTWVGRAIALAHLDWIDPVNGRAGWTHIPFERDDNRVWMDATWAGQTTADVGSRGNFFSERKVVEGMSVALGACITA